MYTVKLQFQGSWELKLYLDNSINQLPMTALAVNVHCELLISLSNENV